jgi:hypothetical protein
VDATYDNGVLTVTLPKREETRPRRIQVRTGLAEGQPQEAQQVGSGKVGGGSGGPRDPGGKAA